jgi:inner membrane transporter RhtA
VSFRLAVALAIAAQLSVNMASGFAVRAFAVTGAAEVVLMRNALSAVLLLSLTRPRLTRLTRRQWAATVAYGVSLALMNSLFYEAIEVMPVGPAVTVEMLGPLILSVALVRRWRAWLWAVLAIAGVAMLSGFDVAELATSGTALAISAGVAWAAYILSTRLVGRVFERADGLAVGMAIAALVSLPRGVAGLASNPFTPAVLGWGVVVALLGTMVPYGLEMAALRGMSAATFGVMTALAPASATLFGWLVAGQDVTWWALGGMALVTAATAGAARGDPAAGRPPD